jgi:5-methylcytosine-specific restriction endonuclease McrA
MKKDILNQTFGSLTVIEKLDSRNYAQYWKCRCVCGNELEKSTEHLCNKVNKKHCGCQDKKTVLVIGQQFKKLTILEETFFLVNSKKQGKRKVRAWKCSCECGKETIVATSDLITGNTTSCGCNKPNYKVDLTGQIFNRLTVISLDTSKLTSDKYWICSCSCGNTIIASSNSLLSGRTQSCKCLQQDRFKIYRLSKGYSPNVSMQKTRTYIRGLVLGKAKIKSTYNNTCQLCQTTYSQASLTIHHIVPVSDNELLCSENKNLIPLCKSCHHIAHNNNWQQIDEYIQKKLANITGLIL